MIASAAARVARGRRPERSCTVIARRRASVALTRTGSVLTSGEAGSREDPLDPRGRAQQPVVVAGRGDELQSERQALRAEARGDRDRGRADERPARTEAWIARRL